MIWPLRFPIGKSRRVCGKGVPAESYLARFRWHDNVQTRSEDAHVEQAAYHHDRSAPLQRSDSWMQARKQRRRLGLTLGVSELATNRLPLSSLAERNKIGPIMCRD